MTKQTWKEALAQWAATANARPHERHREATMVVIAGRDAAHVQLVLIDAVGAIHWIDAPRVEVPDVAREVASGALGRIDLVSLGIAPLPPPPPPPGPIGDDTIYAAKLNAVAAIHTLTQLTALRAAFEQSRR